MENNQRYILKDNIVIEDIKKWQNERKIGKYNVKPLAVEFEITTKCNERCRYCGMGTGKITGKSFLEKEELKKIVLEMYEFGIPSIAITGGEPFLEFENMCYLFSLAKGKIDISKISTNGFWGYDAKKYIDKLVEKGLLNNQFFIPCILLSVGQQKTPIEYICNIVNYITKNFTDKELNVSISFFETEDYKEKVTSFFIKYSELFGLIPENRIKFKYYHYINSKYIGEEIKNKRYPIYKYLNNNSKCFEQSVGDNITPKILMKCDGRCYSCGCFNVSESLMIGNLLKDGVENVIINLNNNQHVKFISQNGIKEFNKILPKEQLKRILVDDYCSACAACIELCEKAN